MKLLLMKQEAQQMLTNPCDAFGCQSRSPNSSIPYVRYSFLLCNSNLRRAVFTIFDFKNVVTLKSGERSLKVIESGIILYTGYGFILVFYRNFVPNTHRL